MLRSVAAVVDGTPRRRRIVSNLLARYYRVRGGDPIIIGDALSQADDLAIAATRSTMRWSAALAGRVSMPKRYRPDRRLVTPGARSAALGHIERRLTDSEDPELRRQRTYLLAERGPGDRETVDFVASELDKRLSSLAVRSPSGRSLPPAGALEVLTLLRDALQAADMRPFLMSGTLLGVVRDGRLLRHDYDLDIGLAPGDAPAVRVADVLRDVPCLTVTVEEWRVWGRHSSGIDFDVFVHYESDQRYWHATRTHEWWNSPFTLVERDVQGQSFLVPDDVDTYLSENYGNWGSPTVFFDKSFDTPNRRFLQTTEALMYLYETVLGATTPSGSDRFVVESAVRELERNFGIDLRHHFGRSVLLDSSADISRTTPDP